jgi:hypothetical protein
MRCGAGYRRNELDRLRLSVMGAEGDGTYDDMHGLRRLGRIWLRVKIGT